LSVIVIRRRHSSLQPHKLNYIILFHSRQRQTLKSLIVMLENFEQSCLTVFLVVLNVCLFLHAELQF